MPLKLKKMQNYITIALATFIFSLMAFDGIAQSDKQDVVYMKDGSIIRGEIIEMHSDSIIKIEVYGGHLLVFEFKEIEKIQREGVKGGKGPFKYKDRGFMVTLESLLLWGQQTAYYGYEPTVGYSFSLINSYVFNQYAHVGLGVGIDAIDALFLPVYLRGGGHLFNSPITPVYYADFGYGLLIDEGNVSAADSHGGWRWGAGVGFKLHTRSEVAFDFTVGLRFQEFYFKQTNWDGSISEIYNTSRRFATRFAMTF